MNTIFDVKRLIGRNLSDIKVQRDIEKWPYELQAAMGDEGEEAGILIKCQFDNELKQFTPAEITAMILEKLKETADAHLGQDTK
mgnify:CR=1 FL=1